MKTKADNKYVVALVDGFSKYSVLKAVEDVGAENTVQFLKEFVSHYGRPMKIISDRGAAFESKSLADFVSTFGIQHVKIASGTPRANGQIEKVNSVIKTCLATCTSNLEADDWDKKLVDVQWAINNSVHTVTKRTPFSIVFQYKSSGLADNPLSKEIQELNEQMGNQSNLEEVDVLLELNREKQCKYYNKGRKAAVKYNAGDLVLVRSEAPATGESRKLTPKYRGPYAIVKGFGNDRYLVGDIEGEQQSARIYKAVLPVDRLKLVSKNDPQESDGDEDVA